MRPDLFEKLKDYTEFSFCFSEVSIDDGQQETIFCKIGLTLE